MSDIRNRYFRISAFLRRRKRIGGHSALCAVSAAFLLAAGGSPVSEVHAGERSTGGKNLSASDADTMGAQVQLSNERLKSPPGPFDEHADLTGNMMKRTDNQEQAMPRIVSAHAYAAFLMARLAASSGDSACEKTWLRRAAAFDPETFASAASGKESCLPEENRGKGKVTRSHKNAAGSAKKGRGAGQRGNAPGPEGK